MARVNYELILLYLYGFKPQDVIRKLGFTRSSAYRFYRIYREARKRANHLIISTDSVSLGKERRVNSLDALRAKKMRIAKRELAETRTGKVETWIAGVDD